MDHQKGTSSSKHVNTSFFLELSDNLDKSKYLDKEGLVIEDGVKALTLAFVNGLAANIHLAHQKGYWDSAEHLRYVIEQLEKTFVSVATIDKGIF